jgi:hypothetical protein
MKVIPTIFDGIKFRSRLEARWAVFFKKIGIEYEWEPESFGLDETAYIPDFYLSNFNGGVYCEVKIVGGDFSKAYLFTEKTGLGIWLCEGPPGFRTYEYLKKFDEETIESITVIPMYDHGFYEKRFWWEPGFNGDFPPEDVPEAFREAVRSANNERFGIFE